MTLDLDTVQGIDLVFRKPSNLEPLTLRLYTQKGFVTPLSCNFEPDITKPISRKIVVAADLYPDMSAGLNFGQAHHSTHTEPIIFKMSGFYDHLLLLQASIDANKASIDDNK